MAATATSTKRLQSRQKITPKISTFSLQLPEILMRNSAPLLLAVSLFYNQTKFYPLKTRRRYPFSRVELYGGNHAFEKLCSSSPLEVFRIAQLIASRPDTFTVGGGSRFPPSASFGIVKFLTAQLTDFRGSVQYPYLSHFVVDVIARRGLRLSYHPQI
jgi:hypothetical protein